MNAVKANQNQKINILAGKSRYLSNSFAAIRTGILIYGENGEFFHANSALLVILGLSAKEFYELKLDNLIHPEELDNIREQIKKTMH